MKSTPNRLRLNVLLAGLVVALTSGCGAGATPSASSPTATRSDTPALTVAEDLTFTGALSGRMTSAGAGDAYVCAATGGSFVAGPILGEVGGQQVELNITKLSFNGPGSYAPAGVSFDAGSDHYYPATAAAGTLVVGPDLQSGTVDIALAANSNPTSVVAHVHGAWRCPPGA